VGGVNSCSACGFDWEQADTTVLVDQLRKLPGRYRVPLTRFLSGEDPDQVLRARPATGSWSTLEYAAHTVDALDFYADRINLIVTEDHPQLPARDLGVAKDTRLDEGRQPEEITTSLSRSAERLVARLEALDAAGWERTGIGSGGDEPSVMDLVRRAAHGGQHHLLDIGRTLRTVRGRS
jgi:hypothetical protein